MFVEYGKRDNPTVIFLHGALAPLTFKRQLSLAVNFHIIYYTFPGHGKRKDKFTREKAVSELLGIIGSIGKEKVNLVGFSLGTQIAMRFLTEQPECIGKTVLISPLIDSSKRTDNRIRRSSRLYGFLVRFWLTACLAAKVLGVKKQNYKAFYETQRHMDSKNLSRAVVYDMLKSESCNFSGDYSDKMLILSGNREAKAFKKSAAYLNDKYKDSKLVYINKAKHNIPFMFNKRLNEILSEFLGV